MSSCSVNADNITGICLSKEDILQLVKAYNYRFPNNTINPRGKTKVKLWAELQSRMNKKCHDDDQVCVVHHTSPNPTKLIKEYFKPVGPKRRYDWLSTSDIDNVMYHYEKIYNDFVFLGAIPRDFFNILPKLGGARNLKKLSKKANRFGVIFNTDKHNQSGSHWLAMFIDLSTNPGTIEHFDSVGSKPTREIKAFLNTLVDRINKEHVLGTKHVVVKINNKQHQRGNNDCGVYALHYIIERLRGRTFDDIVSTVIRDNEMNKKREIYFRIES